MSNVTIKKRHLNTQIKLIRLYSMFRVILALALLVLSFANISIGILIKSPPLTIIFISLGYLSIGLYQLKLTHRSLAVNSITLFSFILIDQIYILSLIHISQDFNNGFPILLFTPVCIAAILFTDRKATFFAATATIGILIEHIFSLLRGSGDSQESVVIGLYGFSFFGISLAFQALSKHIDEANKEALSSEENATMLAAINSRIVERMRTGIIIFNKNNEIILDNKSANDALNDLPKNKIALKLMAWQKNKSSNHLIIQNKALQDIRISFSKLDKQGHIIAFIDDMTELSQQAQQLKLASLGRLTASIAHEIRNPLSAISYSNQLLLDSTTLNENDSDLINISAVNVSRINNIINDILSISKEPTTSPSKLNLVSFCTQLIDEYATIHKSTHIKLDHQSSLSFIAPFDPSQLRQVLVNILDNAIIHSEKINPEPLINIYISQNSRTKTCELRISDNGPGISQEYKNQLFEPFFTTEKKGTGLGLYLSKELCTLNQAHLSYLDTPDSLGATFKISFSHPNRDILVKINNVDNNHD